MKRKILPLLLVLLLLIGCASLDSEIVSPTDDPMSVPPTVNESSGELGYPVNEESVPDDAYPSLPLDDADLELSYPSNIDILTDTDSAYPPPERIYDESKKFAFDRPVIAGGSRVTGIGPVDVSINIISVSNVGELLGSGAIQADGTFDISLARELDSKEAIAIMLAEDSSRIDFLDAPGATDIPMIGFILDMAITE